MGKLIVLLLAAGAAFAQDAGLARLKEELKTAQDQQASEDRQERENLEKTGKRTEENKGHNSARVARVHAALRAWIESRLPVGRNALSVKSSDWESAIREELAAARIGEKPAPDPLSSPEPLEAWETGFDAVSVTLDWKPELPNTLFVTAGVDLRCGEDQAVYVYRSDATGWGRVVSDHPESDFGYGYRSLALSDPDSQGRRMLLIHRGSVQCASSWMQTAYSVYHLSDSEPAESLLSEEHGFWMGNQDDGLIFALKPNELIVELLDNSVDASVHNRTHILRYLFAEGVKRIEPMALQPQDFAEEWLTRPWSEVQARSAPATQKWHGRTDLVTGDYANVISCVTRPDRWSIGFEASYVDENKVETPTTVYFLVRDLGNYRFEMEAVSDSPFEGCPGEGAPSDKHPWLSVEQLKALP